MNPLERFFAGLVQLAMGLVRAIFGGIAGAPVTAARRLIDGVDIRRATAAELIDLRHAVLRQGRPRATAHLDGDDHASTRHWIAKHGDDVIGAVSLMRRDPPAAAQGGDHPPANWQLRGMATVPSWRGKGVGRALLQAVEAEVAEPLWCNARTSAAAFYARHGWRQIGEPFEIPEVGPHVRMVRTPDDAAVVSAG